MPGRVQFHKEFVNFFLLTFYEVLKLRIEIIKPV